MDESIKKTCKKLNLSELNYIKCICRFTKDTINSAKKDIKDNLDIGNDKKRVWALFGKDGKDWYCLEVGSSNNIQTEILSNLQSMQQEPKAVWKGAYFHKDEKLFAFQTYMDRASCKYRGMLQLCEEFCWCEIDIDSYVGANQLPEDMESNDINDHLENYVEAKFAYDTKALFWNPSPATNGNKEKAILQELELSLIHISEPTRP